MPVQFHRANLSTLIHPGHAKRPGAQQSAVLRIETVTAVIHLAGLCSPVNRGHSAVRLETNTALSFNQGAAQGSDEPYRGFRIYLRVPCLRHPPNVLCVFEYCVLKPAARPYKWPSTLAGKTTATKRTLHAFVRPARHAPESRELS